ncbi:AIPR family protein [Luteolibacter soli]|uniref:AIPR family protein n=1 Tax=Luteolibacter soli TaxID=3135280 RepID=A0ABU9B5D0_9BACT
MILEQFAENYRQQVFARCAGNEDGQMREEAFTEEMLEDLTEAGEISEAETCYYRSDARGQAPATKLNAYCFAGDGVTLDLFVCIYDDDAAIHTVTAAEVLRHFKLARGFLQRSMDGFYTLLEESHEVFDVARRIHELRDSLSTVRIYLLTNGIAKVPKGERFDEAAGVLGDIELKPILWDLAKIHQFHESGRQREAIELDFSNEPGGGIPCLGQGEAREEYRTFLAFFPGATLARIYGDFGPRLLERNVRAFLQVKGKVNAGIQQTISETPHRFLAYNNGISATAQAVVLEEVRSGLYVLRSATDFQIVNGGQTTAGIYHAWKKEKADISGVVVQVKLTQAKDAKVLEELVPLISLYANSQNKVNTADFSANGPFHQKLENLSRTTPALGSDGMQRGTYWYYERARGSYLDDKARAGTPAKIEQWQKQHPMTQKFTKTDLAKYENSWDELPHLVSRGAEKNFAHWTSDREDNGWPVVDEIYFKRLVAKAILFRRTEQIVSKQDYPGYRANIVTYSIAWLARSTGHRIDLDEIWRLQGVSSNLVQAIDSVAYSAREHITKPPGGRNITEWCKKEECWNDFRSALIDLPKGLAIEFSDLPLDAPRTGGERLEERWEAVRIHFTECRKPIGEVALKAGTPWPSGRWQHAVCDYAKLNWSQIRAKRSFATSKQRALVATLEWAFSNEMA